MNETKKRMRDTLLKEIYNRMHKNKQIYFLTDDMGAPVVDKIKDEFKDRFINVGIAEQNLINVATGLALEGYIVYAYGIATFFLRAYEQIKINLALLGQMREINVNMIGVGSGVSYDVSGPSHHCLEDITVMRTLPNIEFFSPSDWFISEKFIDYSINKKRPKYIRLDGKTVQQIYDKNKNFKWNQGFFELENGKEFCIISTGYATQVSLNIAKKLKENKNNIGLIDVFMLKPLDEDALFNIIKQYNYIFTIEEGFIDKGGLDMLILGILNKNNSKIPLKQFGFKDEYLFKYGNREFLYKQHKLDENTIIKKILSLKK